MPHLITVTEVARSTLTVNELSDFFSFCPKLDAEDLEDFAKDLRNLRSIIGKAENKWD